MNWPDTMSIQRGGMRQPRNRSGLTLVELLVGMTVTLILSFALIQMFQSIGAGVSAGKANLELAGSLRGVSNTLRHELEGITADVRPWRESGAAAGYLEIHDGRLRDWPPPGQVSIFGDIDDILAYTVRTTGEPFVGRFVDYARVFAGLSMTPEVRTITSHQAEVIWWTRWDDWNDNQIPEAGEITLYRRVLLIAPELNIENRYGHSNGGYLESAFPPPPQQGVTRTPMELFQFHQDNDISVRLQRNSNGQVVGFAANTLADLTRRENRFAHYPIDFSTSPYSFMAMVGANQAQPGFPFPISRAQLIPKGMPLAPGMFVGLDNQPGFANIDDNNTLGVDDVSELGWFGSDDIGAGNLSLVASRTGDDIVLTSVLAFDVRVWDPTAQLRYSASNANEMLAPGDPGYSAGVNWLNPVQQYPPAHGAFVDLFYGSGVANLTSSEFSGAPEAKSRLNLAAGPTYCTWSFDYERDGFNQRVTPTGWPVDAGTNGLDDDGQYGIDDVNERETSPPYPVPLRGIEIRIRNYDDNTRQVRQTRVVANFIPE